MLILAFESSCDETSVAVVRDGQVLASVVSSQIQLHAEYGGVVPELASRDHVRHVLPLIRKLVGDSKVSVEDVMSVELHQCPAEQGLVEYEMSIIRDDGACYHSKFQGSGFDVEHKTVVLYNSRRDGVCEWLHLQM